MSNNLELFIRMRAQELYQEWCNNPDSTVTDIIHKGMIEAVKQYKQQSPVVELQPTGDYQVDTNRFAKQGADGVLEYVDGDLLIEGEVAQDIMGLASAFVLSEEELLKHLVSLGRLAASAELYIKDNSGNLVELGDIK